MNQGSQGISSDASPANPVKRKRGRPRKDLSQNHAGAHAPPGFLGVNGNQPRQVDHIDGANDGLVGQAVTGLVEAVFDAGYLLTVRIGNSTTSLRGVVFKPGHYVPVTAENDVAPHLQMIRRNEIQFSTENQSRGRGNNSRSRERNQQLVSYLSNGSPPVSQVHKPKVKYAAVVEAPPVHPVGERGTVVPVVLQPVDISNGLPPAHQLHQAASRAADMTSSEGKHVETIAPLSFYPPDGSAPTKELPSQTPTNQQVMPKEVKIEIALLNQGMPELQQGEEATSMKSTDVPMSDNVSKGVDGSSQSFETHIENSNTSYKSSAKYSRNTSERDVGDMNEPLFIEPLQAIHSDIRNKTASVSKPFEHYQTGRMTALLQALQENMTENQVPQVEPGHRF